LQNNKIDEENTSIIYLIHREPVICCKPVFSL